MLYIVGGLNAKHSQFQNITIGARSHASKLTTELLKYHTSNRLNTT
jgi:hypothetical protein